ncbi:hypothetical protein ATCC90586_004099 [Pythium insidiosum]|nr:hypothetical protein ATCC90586_004099 [Pythium insidiosum]
MEMHDAFFHDVPAERELPPCDVERLDDILLMVKTMHPTLRAKVLRDLADNDGAYILKLLDLFEIAELDNDKAVLHRIFDIFYALFELCDRRVIELLLNDSNFLTVIGVLGYNPGLIREMDFRSELEDATGYKEVIPIRDANVLARVHMNYRIHVIKDNVLSRSLPDCSVIMLDHVVNENNYHILSYISDVPDYCQSLKDLVRNDDTRLNGLGLLKEVIQLVRVTRPLDKMPQPRRDAYGAPPVFGQLINNLFGDGALFESFSVILGSTESKMQAVELALDILNVLVFYQGPERLRTYLASEGKCIAPPTSDKDRIQWKPGASLFTALIFAFERYEPTRVQMFTLLKEIFKVSLPQDDKFLNVLYPNYIHWLLQPLKYISVDDEAVLFALQDSIMELLTFCTEAHGYRIKYLFGRRMAVTRAMPTMIDIGANLTDPVFVGNYRGKQKHKDDLDIVLRRAKAAGVDKIIVTAYFNALEAACKEGMEDGTVECGLDYDRLEFCPKETQLKYFEKQFELAERTKLPMFLHNRNTDGDFYAVISKNRHRFTNGVVHSFTGSTEEAMKLVELGLFIGEFRPN